jgi:hypothetical protein
VAPIGIALRLAALVLEIDVVAAGELVTAHDLAHRPARLDGAQKAEIVLGVLQVVLAENPVAGGVRVTRQLLVLLEDVLALPRTFTPSGPLESKARLAFWVGLPPPPPPPPRLRPRWRFMPLKSLIIQKPSGFPLSALRRLGLHLGRAAPARSVEDVSVPRRPPGSSSARG